MEAFHVRATLGGLDNPHLTPALDRFAWATQPAGQSDAIRSPGGGVRAHAFPVTAAGGLRSGQIARAWVGDWYHRIHIVPAAIELGFVVNNQRHEIEVWNAHLVPRQLTAATISGGEGIEFDPPVEAPKEYAPLKLRVYELVVRTDGPPIIDAEVLFEFGADSGRITVTGRRMLAWPYAHNWKAPLVERIEYRTDVLAARDGSEQRHCLRDRPRLHYRGEYLAHASAAKRLKALLWAWQGRNFAVPLWQQVQRLPVAVPVGSLSIPVDTANLDYAVGSLVMLILDDRRLEMGEIAEVTPTGLTLVRETEQRWPAGTYVTPARVARLSQATTLKRHTSTVLTLSADWTAGDYIEPQGLEGEALYRGHPVLLRVPNRIGPVDETYQRLLEVLDFGGMQAVDDPVKRAQVVQRVQYVLKDRGEIAWLKRWLHSRRGRWKSFWMPSFAQDLELVRPLTSLSSVAVIEPVGFARYYAEQPGRRDIVIELNNGQRFIRRIAASSTDEEGNDTLLLDAPLGVEVTPSDVRRISFVALCRLDADSIEIAHRTASVAEVAFDVRAIE